MPKIKQPSRLREAALGVMLKFLTTSCRKCTNEGSGDKLRQWIAHIKEDIGPNIPWKLASAFYDRFLTEFIRPNVSLIHQSLALEVIMDRKIVGLKCTHRDALQTLELKDAHRIQGLEELNLTFKPHGLTGFLLQDLTKLTYQEYCTDSDVKIISENCLKLEFLDISRSKKITEEGLRACIALSSPLYPKLRVVKFSECCRISEEFINHFLTTLDSIEKIHALHRSAKPGFDCFTHPDASVHRNIKSFYITTATVSNREMRIVIKKFPNLTELGIKSDSLDVAIDWSMLRFLKKLKKLNISVNRGFSWDNLKSVLRFVGAEIVNLNTHCDSFGPSSCARQMDLDFLFEFCPNIEVLEIDCSARSGGESLVVPTFARLRALSIGTPLNPLHRPPPLECGELPRLEILRIHRFAWRRRPLESLIRDHVRFPNLRELFFAVDTALPSRDIDVIKKLIKVNNLDLQFTVISVAVQNPNLFIPISRRFIRIPVFQRWE